MRSFALDNGMEHERYQYTPQHNSQIAVTPVGRVVVAAVPSHILRKGSYILYETDEVASLVPLANKSRLISQICSSQIYTPIDTHVLSNTLAFIKQAACDAVFKHCNLFVRRNGTVLLQWRKGKEMSAVNIGIESFSFALVGQTGTPMVSGEMTLGSYEISQYYSHQLDCLLFHE